MECQEIRRPGDTGLFKGMAAALLVVLLLKNLSGVKTADPDLWGYMAFGRHFWEEGKFLYQDIFAYVPTLDAWVYHEWLTGVLFYPLYKALGEPGLKLLKYLVGLATAGLVYLTARQRGAGFWSALFCLWLVQVFLPAGYAPVRAQIFTYLFFALSLCLLETVRLTGRWRLLAVLVVLQIPWANLHGGFVVGLGLLLLYGAGEALARRRWRPYLLAFLAAGAVTLINPYGLEYWRYIFRAVTMPRPEITEWASILKAWKEGLFRSNILYFLAMVGYSALLIRWARWRELTPALVLAVTVYLGVKHIRHQIFFMLAAGAYLPVLLEAYGKKFLASLRLEKWQPDFLKLLPVPLLAGCMLVSGFQFLQNRPLQLEFPVAPKEENRGGIHYPLGAIRFIQENQLSGNVLPVFHWGEYLIWSLYPNIRVAMDGRYETVYDDELCHLYFKFMNGAKDWERFLEAYPPDLILIDPRGKIYQLLIASPKWREVYRDEGAALFLSRTEEKTSIAKNTSHGN